MKPRSIRIDQSEVERDDSTLIGEGSFGKVHRGRYRGKPVAIKSLHRVFFEIASDESQKAVIATLVSECELHSSLRHANIVELYGVTGYGTSEMCIVTELMDCSLQQRYSASPPLTLCDHLDIALDIANALEYLHTHKPKCILHRDLAPKNVLLKEDTLGLVAKLADVGLAKAVEISSSHDQMAATLCPGTHSYMPPEALEGQGMAHYGPGLDVYSFGVTVVEMITCRPPSGILPHSHRNDVGILKTRHHPLYELLLQCISDRPAARPHASALVHKLKNTQEAERYIVASRRRAAARERSRSIGERDWRNEYYKILEEESIEGEEARPPSTTGPGVHASAGQPYMDSRSLASEPRSSTGVGAISHPVIEMEYSGDVVWPNLPVETIRTEGTPTIPTVSTSSSTLQHSLREENHGQHPRSPIFPLSSFEAPHGM